MMGAKMNGNSIETEMKWYGQELQLKEVRTKYVLANALRKAEEIMSQGRSTFEAYLKAEDPQVKKAAVGDLFLKTQEMYETIPTAVEVACKAQNARDKLWLRDEMDRVISFTTKTFQAIEQLEQQLSKERALRRTLMLEVEKRGLRHQLDVKAMAECGDEADIARPLAGANAGAQQPPPPPSRSRRLAGRLWAQSSPLLAAGALLLGATLLITLAPNLDVHSVIDSVGRLPSAVLSAAGLKEEEPSLPKSVELWAARLALDVASWLPGVCRCG